MFDEEDDEQQLERVTMEMECDTIGEAAGTVLAQFIHGLENTGAIDEIEIGETIGELHIGGYKIIIIKDGDARKGLN